ncbi:MAG TPA: hypothetical protein ENK49_01730 [Gammaproteobacteria bacterium]|nr:hypothetical protein [Gammaproteobacteria bacterium]
MSDFIKQLRLAEKAAEDIYFAKINRELIESFHRRTRAEKYSARTAGLALKRSRRKAGLPSADKKVS